MPNFSIFCHRSLFAAPSALSSFALGCSSFPLVDPRAEEGCTLQIFLFATSISTLHLRPRADISDISRHSRRRWITSCDGS